MGDFSRLRRGEKQTIIGTLAGTPQVYRDSRPSRTLVVLSDRHDRLLWATFFGDPREILGKIGFPVGRICLRGTVDVWKNRLQLRNPVWIEAEDIGRVVPVYPGKDGVISPATVRQRMDGLLADAIPMAAAWLRRRLGCSPGQEVNLVGRFLETDLAPDFERLLASIHFPACPETGAAACRALRRLATLDVLKQARAATIRPAVPGAGIFIPDAAIDQILADTSLMPTKEQRAIVGEICRDMAGNQPMLRLLSADVGFGKTYVAGAVCAAVARLGHRVVWLSPNQPLAVQTRNNLATWWPELEPGLVVGDADGVPETRFLVGTTALLYRLPAGFQPTLLVIDEEQKFGAQQKSGLAGPKTHILKATATCIPRTAALLEYGGMAVSRLTTPHVRKEIRTRIVTAEHRAKLFDSIRRTVGAGYQALIIYPLAESHTEAEVDRKSAEGAFALWEKHFPGRVRFMHGKLREADKLSAIEDMRTDRADLLISTVAVETGIDLSRLRHVVVVHPERLGVNTLHQIRGRVARTGGVGLCHLFLPAPIGEESLTRLKILVEHSDGFDVARENMKLQGFGDIALGGNDQSGASYSFLPGHVLEYADVEFVSECGCLHF